MNYSFQEESAMDLRSLRFLVLWPHKSSIDECLLDADFEKGTKHFSARDENNEVVACCTMMHEARTIDLMLCNIRLRAMATHPSIRGAGIGKKLLSYAISNYQGENFWCDARQIAVPFYLNCGWQVRSEPYQIPIIGTHYLMTK
jgi:predicted GNAT family N-acyltransferase